AGRGAGQDGRDPGRRGRLLGRPDALVRAASLPDGQGPAHPARGGQPGRGLRRRHRRLHRGRHPLAQAGPNGDRQPGVTAYSHQNRTHRPGWAHRVTVIVPGGLHWRPVIRLEHVTKRYPKASRPSLDDVSCEIEKGDFVFFIGPSGSGKSTFVKLLLREITPSKGKVVVNERDIGTMRSWKVPNFRRSIGCVFQDFRLLPNRTAFENVAFALEVIGKTKT